MSSIKYHNKPHKRNKPLNNKSAYFYIPTDNNKKQAIKCLDVEIYYKIQIRANLHIKRESSTPYNNSTTKELTSEYTLGTMGGVNKKHIASIVRKYLAH